MEFTFHFYKIHTYIRIACNFIFSNMIKTVFSCCPLINLYNRNFFLLYLVLNFEFCEVYLINWQSMGSFFTIFSTEFEILQIIFIKVADYRI